MDSSNRIICWGEVLWDLFPDGRRLGGAPANVAYHLASLGACVALVSRVGDDALGHEAVAALAAAGVDTSLIQVDPVLPTGRVEVEVRAGEPSYRLTPDCAWERIQVTAEVKHALAGARAFCFGTLSQRIERGEIARAIALLPGDCLRVCDPNLRPRHIDLDNVRAALSWASVVKVNDLEAQSLAHMLGVESLAAWLCADQGVKVIALTRGPRGSELITPAERAEHPGFPADPGGDNVGAGDAFTAVLVHGLCQGRALHEINRAANRYAAFVASCRGATPEVPVALLQSLW